MEGVMSLSVSGGGLSGTVCTGQVDPADPIIISIGIADGGIHKKKTYFPKLVNQSWFAQV